MSGLCEYKNLFGEEGKGAHSYRFAGFAIVDVLATIVVSALISWLTSWSFWNVLVSMFLLGILLHRLFCVRTTIDRLIFT